MAKIAFIVRHRKQDAGGADLTDKREFSLILFSTNGLLPLCCHQKACKN